MNAAIDNTQCPSRDQIKCMEVWGGTGAVRRVFSRPGIDLWIQSSTAGDASACGGEVHFLSSCASGRITRMVIADLCAEPGVFSELAAGLSGLIKRNVNRIRQSRFLRDMNQGLREVADHDGFCTAVVATYFAPTRSFALCNTGHPPPFLFRVKRQEWSVLKRQPAAALNNSNVPDGIVDADEYQYFEERLETGDMVLCYSNSLTECRDANNQYLGVEGLRERVISCGVSNPADIAYHLTEHIRAEHPENLVDSDATILLCRATDTGVGWKNNLLAPLRMLAGVTDSTRIA